MGKQRRGTAGIECHILNFAGKCDRVLGWNWALCLNHSFGVTTGHRRHPNWDDSPKV